MHTAAEENQRLMFSLVKKQRGNKARITKELNLDGARHSGDLLPIWKKHFSRLAIHQPKEVFTQNRINQAVKDLEVIQDLCDTRPLTIPITKAETRHAIKQLKSKKAADIYNLQAEHMKTSPSSIVDFLTPVINRIIADGYIPANLSLKEGIKHPIPKKDKDITNPGNHRGIYICPILGYRPNRKCS